MILLLVAITVVCTAVLCKYTLQCYLVIICAKFQHGIFIVSLLYDSVKVLCSSFIFYGVFNPLDSKRSVLRFGVVCLNRGEFRGLIFELEFDYYTHYAKYRNKNVSSSINHTIESVLSRCRFPVGRTL